jgi:hypothetical protein
MKPLLAIAWLAIQSAVRHRVFVVLGAMCAAIVAGLPMVVKDDGTAAGLAQITLTYTLGSVTVLLGIATVWIAAASIAREASEAQLQLVDVKPIPRWQMWLGKWLGIVALNAALLLLSGLIIALTLEWRTRRLTPELQEAMRNEVLVARASVKEAPTDVDAVVRRFMESDEAKRQITDGARPEVLEENFRNEYLATQQVVQPDHLRRWVVDMSAVPRANELPLRLKVRFEAAAMMENSTQYDTFWEFGPLDKPRPRLVSPRFIASTYHEFDIPPGLLNEKGELIVDCSNRSETTLFFDLNKGLEVMYREGGFLMNLARCLAVLLCWLALLAAIGLASGSGLSFPVASFTAFTVLIIGLSSSLVTEIVKEGIIGGPEHRHEDGKEVNDFTPKLTDKIVVPLFKALILTVDVVRDFAPVEAVSTGRTLPWSTVISALLRIVVLASGVVVLAGIFLFNRRELALAQGRS